MSMAPRATWKGYLQLALITCPVALYPATGEGDRSLFNLVNAKTGNRIRQQRIDDVTGAVVDNDDIVKGVKVAENKYVIVTDEEIASVAPPSAQVMKIETFTPWREIDAVIADRAYFLSPDGEAALEAFVLIARAMAKPAVVGLARLTLGTREHLVAIEPRAKGMLVTTLRTPAELRDEEACFARIGRVDLAAELIAGAHELIADRIEAFDPAGYPDRYAAAIAELVRRKIAGTMLQRAAPPAPPRMRDLADAVQRSRAQAKRGGKKPLRKAG